MPAVVGRKVEFGLVAVISCEAEVLGPLAIDHEPVPMVGVLPESAKSV